MILNFLLRFSNNLSTEPPLFLVRLRDPGKTLVKLDNSLKTIICHIIRYNFDYSRQIDKGLLTMKLKQWRNSQASGPFTRRQRNLSNRWGGERPTGQRHHRRR